MLSDFYGSDNPLFELLVLFLLPSSCFKHPQIVHQAATSLSVPSDLVLPLFDKAMISSEVLVPTIELVTQESGRKFERLGSGPGEAIVDTVKQCRDACTIADLKFSGDGISAVMMKHS